TDRAVAFVNCSRPRGGEAETEPIKCQVAVFAAIDPPDADAMTKTGRRRRRELAWTTIIAIACLKIISIEKPFRHMNLPFENKNARSGLPKDNAFSQIRKRPRSSP